MPARLPALLLAGAADLAVLGILTGCSGGSSAGSSGSSGSSPGAAGDPATSSDSPAAASAASLDDLCTLLPLDAANAVVGVVFAAADSSVDGTTGDHLCTYRTADGTTTAVLGLVAAGRTTFDEFSTRNGAGMPIDQVGDRAVISGGELDFQVGDHLFYVASTGSADAGIGNLTALGSATVAHLS